MKLAVTGATGFVGRHLVESLRARGHVVRALVRNPAATTIGDEAAHFDLSRVEGFDAAVSGTDVVIHAAAHLPASYADPKEARACFEANALGTLDLLLACVRASVKKVLVFSSNVYRQSASPAAEDAPTYPSTHAPYYLMSKLCADVWTEHFRQLGNLETTTLRLASVFGPGLTRGMIPTFTSSLLRGAPITIRDGGRYRSDLVYVGDVIDATIAAVSRHAPGVFNVGSGTTASVLEVAEALLEHTGASRDLLRVEDGPSSSATIGFAPLDVGRARAELGYSPRPLASALGEYVRWYRSTPS